MEEMILKSPMITLSHHARDEGIHEADLQDAPKLIDSYFQSSAQLVRMLCVKHFEPDRTVEWLKGTYIACRVTESSCQWSGPIGLIPERVTAVRISEAVDKSKSKTCREPQEGNTESK